MDIKFYFGIIFFIMLLMLIVIFVLVDVCYELKDEMVKLSSDKKLEGNNKKKERFKPAYYIPKAEEIKEHRACIDIPFEFDDLVSDMEIKESLGKQLIDEVLPYIDISFEEDFAKRNVKYIGRIRVVDTKEDNNEVRK